MRRVLLALAVILIASIASPPRGARAASLQTVGCAAQGYTMQIPGDWTVQDRCTSSTQMKDATGDMQMAVNVERHGYWNDARTRSSIRGDVARAIAAASATQGSEIIFKVNTIHGRRFLAGLVQIDFSNSPSAYMAEQETFYAGYMYKFVAFTHVDDSAVKFAGLIWGTIRITKRL